MKIKRYIANQIFSDAFTADPDESCGLLLGDGETINEFHKVINDDPGPMSFALNPLDQIMVRKYARSIGKTVMAVYHSHPKGPSRLSSSDRAQALDPNLLWVLISMIHEPSYVLQCFKVVDGEAQEIELTLID